MKNSNQTQNLKKKNFHNESDKKEKTIAIVVEVILSIIGIGVFTLYGIGNQYVVANTIDGMPILIGSLPIGLGIGILIAFIAGKSKLKHIKYANLQEFIGLWSLLIPTMFIAFTAFSMNLSLAKEKPENIQTTVIDKSGDLVTQSYRLTTSIKGKEKKIEVTKSEWNNYKINDTLNLSLVNGFFGFNVVRHQ